MKRFKTGLVLGKFYPLTKGHQHLIDRAHQLCTSVTIVISHRDEAIPASIRVGWLKELYPNSNVVLIPKSTPYFISECPSEHEFYIIWRKALLDACGCVPEAVFSSEEYGNDVALYLGNASIRDDDPTKYNSCIHYSVDEPREIVPISGTKVRTDPWKYWNYLDPVVRAYFVKTICIYGAESCGKTTLAKQLAEHYNTVWQHEWARPYLDEVNRHCEYEDMAIIGKGHFQDRCEHLKRANKIMFVDSDTYTTMVYSEKYYGRYPVELDAIAANPRNQNDLYLLMDTDIPWVKDTTRDLGDPAVRAEMFERFRSKLDKYNKPYVLVGGQGEDRFNNAVAVVDRYLLNTERAIADIKPHMVG